MRPVCISPASLGETRIHHLFVNAIQKVHAAKFFDG
jgi:hypothetical protein